MIRISLLKLSLNLVKFTYIVSLNQWCTTKVLRVNICWLWCLDEIRMENKRVTYVVLCCMFILVLDQLLVSGL
jgi:hypothetical protein